MSYGFCDLSLVPVRENPSDITEMITQLVFGDVFEIIKTKSKWVKIKSSFDDYEGWIDAKQFMSISKAQFHTFKETQLHTSTDLLDYITNNNGDLQTIVLGSSVRNISSLGFVYDGIISKGKPQHSEIIPTALLFLNTPYLWGGKSPFGIDCSGFTQMVYKRCGIALARDAYQQAKQGMTLSFIEEAQPGDLAFFDNEENRITHVGIIMQNNYIIHAHGKVRIDRIDHTGIFDPDTNTYSHTLRLIKHFKKYTFK